MFEDYKANVAAIEAAKAANTPSAELPRLVAPGITGLQSYIDETDRAAREGKAPPKILLTTLDSDLVTLLRQKKAGKTVDQQLEANLMKLKKWWDTQGRLHYEEDKDPLLDARLYGAKTALLYTAIVPLLLAIGFLILIAYFYFTGGYKQVHLDETHPPMEEY